MNRDPNRADTALSAAVAGMKEIERLVDTLLGLARSNPPSSDDQPKAPETAARSNLLKAIRALQSSPVQFQEQRGQEAVSKEALSRAFAIYSAEVGIEGCSGLMSAICSGGLRKVLEDALASAPSTAVAAPEREVGWRPIETAPRHNRAVDGSTNQPHIIGYDGARVGEIRHHDCTWYWCEGGEETLPTHWRPLPEPPFPDHQPKDGTGQDGETV